jgi:hypothetical protein
VADDQALAMLPDFRGDVQLFPQATRYSITVDVTFDPEGGVAVLHGLARIQFTNPLDKPLFKVALMLWPNHNQYEATMTAGPILVEENLIEPEILLGGLALQFGLMNSIPPGEMIDFSIPFKTEARAFTSFTPKRFGIAEGVLLAPTFYPLVPRLSDDGWEVEDAPPGGDTTNSDIAFYTVEITAPADLALVASGVAAEHTVSEDGSQRIKFLTGPMRDFTFSLGNLELKTRQAGAVKLNVWVLPDHQDDVNTILSAAKIQMELFEELIGPYPYTELDIVDAPGAYGGIEYPGLVYIGTLGSTWVVEPTVHEVAHQWFYGILGDDQLREPWLDEAAATYAEALYYERAFGIGRATGFLSNLRAFLRSYPEAELPIGLAVGDYPSETAYGVIVYSKGALFFEALRIELGDRAFFQFLSTFFEQHRYEFVTSTDFQVGAETACDCDLQDLFDLWVYEGGEFLDP